MTKPADGIITRASDQQIMFVRLWQHEVLIGPSALLEEARASGTTDLADEYQLLVLSRRWGGRLLGTATLAFQDHYVSHEQLNTVTVTDDLAAVIDLEKACPPDDVAEFGLAELSRALVTLNELDEPTAGAGYAEWEQIIAHLGVLTPPAFRRRGFGVLAAALAIKRRSTSASFRSGGPGSAMPPPESWPPGSGSPKSARRPQSCWRPLRTDPQTMGLRARPTTRPAGHPSIQERPIAISTSVVAHCRDELNPKGPCRVTVTLGSER